MKKAQRHKSYQFSNPVYLRGLLTGGVITSLTYVYYELRKARQDSILKVEAEQQAKIKEIEDQKARVKAERGLEILKYGTPVTGQNVLYYANHALVYDQQKRIPTWVAEQITPERLEGKASRKNVEFQPDPGIDPMFSAQNKDYKGSGWSRGHMCPAGNNKLNQEAMEESFYLTNILPQNFQNNAGFWNRLEMYCRNLTKTFPTVNIISGPVFKPEEAENGKKIVKYQVIGEGNVSVPTHLFKIITVEDKRSIPRAMGAFIVPNEYIGYDRHLTEYQVELEEVERLTGVKFMPKVNRNTLTNLCKVDKCKLIERNEFELYFIGRKLDSANTMHRLEKVWGELEEKKLTPDKYLRNLYTRKKKELASAEKSSDRAL